MTATTYRTHWAKEVFLPGSEWADAGKMRPGRPEYDIEKRKESLDRRRTENVRSNIDQKPPSFEFKEHLKIFKMRRREKEKDEIETENRWLVNRVAYIWRTTGQVDHVNQSPHVPTRRKGSAILAARETAQNNLKLMRHVDDAKRGSYYDRQKFLQAYDDNKLNSRNMQKYDKQIWDPIFKQRKKREARRGRALDPNYVWRF